MESFLDIHFQSFIFRVQIFHPNEVMEEANIFTDFSLKPIRLHLGKAQSGPSSSGRETLTFAGGSVDGQNIAKHVCDTLLQEDVALLSAVNPYHTDRVLHLRNLWWAPQAAALVHSLALKHTAFAGEEYTCWMFTLHATPSPWFQPNGSLFQANRFETLNSLVPACLVNLA